MIYSLLNTLQYGTQNTIITPDATVMGDTAKKAHKPGQVAPLCLGNNPKRRHHYLLFSEAAQYQTSRHPKIYTKAWAF